MNDIKNSIQIREDFWKSLGKLDSDVLTHLINPAFMSNMPAWPSLRQVFLKITLPNGNTILASDGLSESFDEMKTPNQGFEVELYVETDEKIESVKDSYQFDLLYQVSQVAANAGTVKDLLEEFGVLTIEVYDVRVPESFKNSEGRVGAILGLDSKNVSSKIMIDNAEVRLVNVKLLTLKELEFVVSGGEDRTLKLRELFDKTSGSITSLNRESVI